MAKPTYNDKLAEYFGKRKVNFNPQQHPTGGPILGPLVGLMSLLGGGKQSTSTPVTQNFAVPSNKNVSIPTKWVNERWAPQTFGELGQDEMRIRWAEKTETNVPYEDYDLDEPSTKLTEGLLRGAKIPNRLIEDIKSAGQKYGVDPLDILSVAATESTFGYGPYGSKRVRENRIDSKSLFTFNDFTVKPPKTFEEFAFDKGRKVDHNVDSRGHQFSVSEEEKENLYNDHDLKKEYVKYLSKFEDSPEQNSVIDLVAKRLKNKGISAINPGDSSYLERVQQYKEMLKNNRTPIKFQQGGYASGDPLNFMFPSSGLVPTYAKDGLSGYFEDPLMLPHAKGGGFFGGIWKGIKGVGKAIGKGVGAAADQTLSFFGAPDVIQNSVYDQQPQWVQGLNSGVGGVMSSVLGSAIPGVGLGLSALQGLGNRSQGQQGGQYDFSSLFAGGNNASGQNYNSGSLLQGLMGGNGSFGGNTQQQQYGTALGQLLGNFQGQGFGGINPFGTPGFNPQPRMYEDGGEVQQGPAMIPIQTEKGEVFVHLDGSITPVNARKTHKQMDDDEVTDVVPEGTYVTSNDKKIQMTLKQAEEIVMGLKALPYEEFKKGVLPEEQLFSEIFGNTKKMTPAEMTQKILRKFPTMDRSTTWTKNDIFTEMTNKENMNNRLPWLEQVIMFNESKRPKRADEEFQTGGPIPPSDSLRHQAGKTMDYEFLRGSAAGTGLSNYGNPALGPNPSKEQAVEWYMQNIAPQLGSFPTAMEKGEAGDFLYNTGRDPRIYMLDQYLKSKGQSGLANRGSYNVDSKSPEWAAKKQELDKEWAKHESAINKLSVNDRRVLLNKGRDFYYQNIDKVNGQPNPAYGNTWYGRIWNTNEYTPFNPNDPRFTPKFKTGGTVRMEGVRHLPKGGSVSKFPKGGDILSVLGTAAPFLLDLFGANKGKSNIDPIARNMILGSSPLYASGVNENINAQSNQLGTAIQDFTGLGQNLNNFAGAQAGANIAGRALQQTDFQKFDPRLQDQRLANFNTRTPNAVIDALSTPNYDLNALAGTLGPRGFNTFASQLVNSDNQTRNNAILGQFNQDRSLGMNVLGQRNALDSFSQQFNIGQGEKQQAARNAQTAGIFGDVSSYFGRLGDIQSQILPITTQFALQKAGLAGQKQMATAQNLMNTGSIYAQLGNQSGGNQGQGGQQQQQTGGGNYDMLKNIIFGSNTNTGNPIGNNFSNIGNMIGQLFGGGKQQNNNNLYGNQPSYQDCINGYSTLTGLPC